MQRQWTPLDGRLCEHDEAKCGNVIADHKSTVNNFNVQHLSATTRVTVTGHEGPQ